VNHAEWPIVVASHLRPHQSGWPDLCRGCDAALGQKHQRDCVLVQKRVEHLVQIEISGETFSALWLFDEPHEWSPDMSEFHKNESSWCAFNFRREKALGSVQAANINEFWRQVESLPECFCEAFSSKFVRIIDATPRLSR
jgi:hypothetical protein